MLLNEFPPLELPYPSTLGSNSLEGDETGMMLLHASQDVVAPLSTDNDSYIVSPRQILEKVYEETASPRKNTIDPTKPMPEKEKDPERSTTPKIKGAKVSRQ